MKFNLFILFITSILIISCTSSTNSDEFINKTKGRYLYSSDEIIEVYFKNKELQLKWRGADEIKPLKVNENLFFVKEMNEKLEFNLNTNGTFITIIPKQNDSIVRSFRKLAANEKIPSEYLEEGNIDKALESYLAIKKNDSLDETIKENYFNKLGYKKLRNKEYDKALAIFKINMELYPNSANVYDSYADALKQKGDTLQAIVFYKKSIAIDSGNKRAKRFIEKYDQK